MKAHWGKCELQVGRYGLQADCKGTTDWSGLKCARSGRKEAWRAQTNERTLTEMETKHPGAKHRWRETRKKRIETAVAPTETNKRLMRMETRPKQTKRATKRTKMKAKRTRTCAVALRQNAKQIRREKWIRRQKKEDRFSRV
jgi:hypothetical protein